MPSFEDSLRQALQLELPYSLRPGPREGLQEARPAAVLALLSDAPSLLLTQRTEQLDHHKGQMAFPGGARDLLADGSREDAISAALRETEEEVGIARELVHVLGRLPTLYTPTGFEIEPIVGILKVPTSQAPLRTNDAEIAEALWIDLALLSRIHESEEIVVGPFRYTNHIFQAGPHRIWGATGAIIKNLLDRLGPEPWK